MRNPRPEIDTRYLARLTARLAHEAGLEAGDGWGPDVAITLRGLAKTLPQQHNNWLKKGTVRATPGAAFKPFTYKTHRHLPAPTHHCDLPPSFTGREGEVSEHEGYTDPVDLISIPNGYVLQFGPVPVVLAADGCTVLLDCSHNYAPLMGYVDVDLRGVMAQAPKVDGTLFVLDDGTRPSNYCHWLIDWLPRLVALKLLGARDDIFLVVPPLDAPYQRETLRLCGYDDAHILELGPMEAVTARELVVTSDRQKVPHPMFKAAPWARRFLRQMVGGGFTSPNAAKGAGGSKLYISRGDARGRRILNEDSLMQLLTATGYERVELTGMSVQEQAQLFAGASHIIGPHGAGLANVVFAPSAGVLLELFPNIYGMSSYYSLAAGDGFQYHSYVTDRVISSPNPQYDDMEIDVDDFAKRCADVLWT